MQTRIVAVEDIGVRRMSAAENLQREDLTIFETIEAIVEIADAELIEDQLSGSHWKTSLPFLRLQKTRFSGAPSLVNCVGGQKRS